MQTQRNADGQLTSNLSIVDHFGVSPNLLCKIEQAGVFHSADTAEDHSPIFLKLSCDISITPKSESGPFISKPAWKKAKSDDIDNYCHNLSKKNRNLVPSEDILLCRDLHCSNPSHLDQITAFTNDVLEAIVASVEETIPMTKPTNTSSLEKCLPGWTEHVKPFKDEADFGFSLWISANKPQNNDLHWAMRHSRNQYHYAFRRLKKKVNLIKNNKFLNACLNGGVNIFKEIK